MLTVTIPFNELLRLWSELVEAYHGVNGYGGYTAELYAYRFVGDSPAANKLSGQVQREAEEAQSHCAYLSLRTLVQTFLEMYTDAAATIDGVPSGQWFASTTMFVHRAHVEISRK
jgi:hypothetical protein